MGWLNATPKKKKEPRIKSMTDDQILPMLPDLSGLEHLIDLWTRCGKCLLNGMQATPITWGEIESFSRFNPVTSFEAQVIMSMSRGYIDGVNDTESVNPPTYELMSNEERIEANRKKVAAQFAQMKAERKGA